VYRKNSPERIVTSTEPSHLALMSRDGFGRAQDLFPSNSFNASERPRTNQCLTSAYQPADPALRLGGRGMSGHRRDPTSTVLLTAVLEE